LEEIFEISLNVVRRHRDAREAERQVGTGIKGICSGALHPPGDALTGVEENRR
jgi:hypothetical protein